MNSPKSTFYIKRGHFDTFCLFRLFFLACSSLYKQKKVSCRFTDVVCVARDCSSTFPTLCYPPVVTSASMRHGETLDQPPVSVRVRGHGHGFACNEVRIRWHAYCHSVSWARTSTHAPINSAHSILTTIRGSRDIPTKLRYAVVPIRIKGEPLATGMSSRAGLTGDIRASESFSVKASKSSSRLRHNL
jgi:hypothetical protein